YLLLRLLLWLGRLRILLPAIVAPPRRPRPVALCPRLVARLPHLVAPAVVPPPAPAPARPRHDPPEHPPPIPLGCRQHPDVRDDADAHPGNADDIGRDRPLLLRLRHHCLLLLARQLRVSLDIRLRERLVHVRPQLPAGCQRRQQIGVRLLWVRLHWLVRHR